MDGSPLFPIREAHLAGFSIGFFELLAAEEFLLYRDRQVGVALGRHRVKKLEWSDVYFHHTAVCPVFAYKRPPRP